MSRLKLNFELNSTDERANFIQEYVNNWKYSPFTEDELEMMGNYILWGRNPDTGKNVVQEKTIQIATKNSHWQSGHEEESLDELLETPTFNEGIIIQGNATQYRTPREVFSRKDALAAAPENIRDILIDLFRRIDELDLIINFYDLRIGKRINPPRQELLSKFSEEEINKLKEKAESWNQRKYLQNRHLLVELRREQYTIRDTYIPVIMRHTPRQAVQESTLGVFDEIDVFPVGLFNKLLFKDFEDLNPSTYTETELAAVSKILLNLPKHDEREGFYFDFTNEDSIHELINLFTDLEDEEEKRAALHILEGESKIIDTLKYYIRNSEMSPAQREILDMKINKVHNEEIAGVINSKYGKAYTINYISTIYRQKIIPAIVETAKLHQDILENLFYPENFKACTTCGRILLKDNRNFVKKSRAKDGFASRCKCCDKIDREQKKLR